MLQLTASYYTPKGDYITEPYTIDLFAIYPATSTISFYPFLYARIKSQIINRYGYSDIFNLDIH